MERSVFFATSWSEGKGLLISTHPLLPLLMFVSSSFLLFLLEVGPGVLQYASKTVGTVHQILWCCWIHCDSFYTSLSGPLYSKYTFCYPGLFLHGGRWEVGDGNLLLSGDTLVGTHLSLQPPKNRNKERKSHTNLAHVCPICVGALN